MPSSAVHTFTDPDAYFARIRHMPIEGVVLQRGQFRAASTLIDLHRLLMYRSDEDLPRIMRVTRLREGLRSLIIFATSADQPETIINGVETSQNQIATLGLDLQLYLRSSTHSKWGSMSLTAEDLAAAGEAIIGRELVLPPLINTVAPSAPICCGCGSSMKRLAISRRLRQTSSRSPRSRERWSWLWLKRWFSA